MVERLLGGLIMTIEELRERFLQKEEERLERMRIKKVRIERWLPFYR